MNARLGLLLLALLAAGCGPRTPRVVLLLEVDALRADALGCYGNHATGENGTLPSPRIDALAADGLRFEHAYATAPAAQASLRSQFTGAWPWEEPAGEPLAARVRALGWRTAAVASSPDAAARAEIGAGFERFEDAAAPEALARLLACADELAREPGAGLFLFGHLAGPAYTSAARPGLRFGPAYAGALRGDETREELLARRDALSSDDLLFLRGRYQSELAFVDRALGELLDGLMARGWYEEALVVLVSDHGEELLERGGLGHGHSLRDELVHVPWIVKLPASAHPSRKGRKLEDVVSLIDLPATLLEFAGAKPADGLLGHSRSLLPVLARDEASARRWIYLHAASPPREGGALWGVIDAQTALKWVVDHAPETPRGSLHDLKHDIHEKNDLAARVGAGREAPMQRLRALLARPLAGARAAPAILPEEPWIPRPAELDGAGPALLHEPR